MTNRNAMRDIFLAKPQLEICACFAQKQSSLKWKDKNYFYKCQFRKAKKIYNKESCFLLPARNKNVYFQKYFTLRHWGNNLHYNGT